MQAKRTKQRKYLTIVVCFLAYSLVFLNANPHLLDHDEKPDTQSAAAERVTASESHADMDYFNSPQVGRAMSLDSPEPYDQMIVDMDHPENI